MRSFVAALTLSFLMAATAHGREGVVWQEDFDGVLTQTGANILKHPLIQNATGMGIDRSNAIKVTYQGFPHGSKRVGVHGTLSEPRLAYTLGFSVRFCQDFDFAKGGKLHGLGPKYPVSGGRPITPEGWSARLMFKHDGGLKTYVYHQRLKKRYGVSKAAKGFRFVRDKYYDVALRVTLNSPVSAANGAMDVWVDGKHLITHDKLQWRSTDTTNSLVQTIMFSTFHGGNSAGWAPRNRDGSFKTDCAYFDNWYVAP